MKDVEYSLLKELLAGSLHRIICTSSDKLWAEKLLKKGRLTLFIFPGDSFETYILMLFMCTVPCRNNRCICL